MISIIVFKAALLFLLWAALTYKPERVDPTKEIRIRAADAQRWCQGEASWMREVGPEHMDRHFGEAMLQDKTATQAEKIDQLSKTVAVRSGLYEEFGFVASTEDGWPVEKSR